VEVCIRFRVEGKGSKGRRVQVSSDQEGAHNETGETLHTGGEGEQSGRKAQKRSQNTNLKVPNWFSSVREDNKGRGTQRRMLGMALESPQSKKKERSVKVWCGNEKRDTSDHQKRNRGPTAGEQSATRSSKGAKRRDAKV